MEAAAWPLRPRLAACPTVQREHAEVACQQADFGSSILPPGVGTSAWAVLLLHGGWKYRKPQPKQRPWLQRSRPFRDLGSNRAVTTATASNAAADTTTAAAVAPTNFSNGGNQGRGLPPGLEPETSAPCAEWGCRCGGRQHGRSYEFQTNSDYHHRHPAVASLASWCKKQEIPPPAVYRSLNPDGYRTRATLGVGLPVAVPEEMLNSVIGSSSCNGPHRRAIVGLFRSRSAQVIPPGDCAVNHPALAAAVREVQRVLDALHDIVQPFDHAAPEPWKLSSGALRHVEFTVERVSGLVQLVLVWNGERGQQAPELQKLVENLWGNDGEDAVAEAETEDSKEQPTHQEQRQKRIWHSIWVHWRHPDFFLARAIHSKRSEAWEQLRPCPANDSGGVSHVSSSAEVEDTLDGLPFAFGPASFQQANLAVFGRILQDMKAALQRLSPVQMPRPGQQELSAQAARAGSSRPKQTLRLLELCGGVGVIGLSLAHAAIAEMGWDPSNVELLSTDLNPGNTRPFAANASRIFPGHIRPHAEFRALSTEDVLRKLARRSGGKALGLNGQPEILVLDPPRRGLAADWREVGKSGPRGGEWEASAIRRCSGLRAIIYMSCGHESFMVDAERLTRNERQKGKGGGKPFRLAALACYDMFPYTSQIETLGIFVR